MSPVLLHRKIAIVTRTSHTIKLLLFLNSDKLIDVALSQTL